MKKSVFDSFIKKYNLNSLVEAVRIVSDGKSLSTSFITDDRSLLGMVKCNSLSLEPFEVGINDTAKLKNLIAILDSEVDLSLVKKDDKALAFSFSDKNESVVNFMLAEIDVIPAPPKLKSIPTFDVEIPFTREFITTFIKAKNALSDVDRFTLLNSPKGLQFVIGHSNNINSNKIKLAISPVAGKDKLKTNLDFSAKYLKEVLSANSEVDGFTFFVSSDGLARIELNTVDYASEYYFVALP